MGTVESLRHNPYVVTDPASAPARMRGEGAVEGETETTTPPLARTGFRVGDWRLLFPSSAGREVIPMPAVSRVPNTSPWLLGLANARGNLIPIVDLTIAFGAVRAAGVSAYVLIFGQGEAAIGLSVDGLPHLLTLQASEGMAVSLPLPPLLEGNVLAAYDYDGDTWLDLDLPRLFETLARGIVH